MSQNKYFELWKPIFPNVKYIYKDKLLDTFEVDNVLKKITLSSQVCHRSVLLRNKAHKNVCSFESMSFILVCLFTN